MKLFVLMLLTCGLFLFFFFQAEDGIRDFHVTGVQTCALPILSRGYDATPLFEHVSFEIHAGERIGFVGPNGAGKTTLLRVLAGLDQPDTGKVTLHAGARLGILQQVAEFPPGRTLFDEAKSAFDELMATQKEFERVAEQLAAATDETRRKQLAAK